jgi:hypothetical protein
LYLHQYHHDDLNKAYFLPIQQTCLGDYIETNLNIMTEKGLMNFLEFKWTPLKTEKTPGLNFLEFNANYKTNREIFDYNSTRICELEIIKYFWSDISKHHNHEEIIEQIRGMFEPNFKVDKIQYNNVGQLIFKVFLLACKVGQINNPEKIGITLDVVYYNNKISNEVKKNCLIFDRKNELQCRIGDTIVYYISYNV